MQPGPAHHRRAAGVDHRQQLAPARSARPPEWTRSRGTAPAPMPSSTPRLRSIPHSRTTSACTAGPRPAAIAPQQRALAGAGAADHEGVPAPQRQQPRRAVLPAAKAHLIDAVADASGRLAGAGSGQHVAQHQGHLDHRRRHRPNPVRHGVRRGRESRHRRFQLVEGLPSPDPNRQRQHVTARRHTHAAAAPPTAVPAAPLTAGRCAIGRRSGQAAVHAREPPNDAAPTGARSTADTAQQRTARTSPAEGGPARGHHGRQQPRHQADQDRRLPVSTAATTEHQPPRRHTPATRARRTQSAAPATASDRALPHMLTPTCSPRRVLRTRRDPRDVDPDIAELAVGGRVRRVRLVQLPTEAGSHAAHVLRASRVHVNRHP